MNPGIRKNHLLYYIIKPTNLLLEMESAAANNLLLGTAAQESLMGHYLYQEGGGPARGIYQTEINTHSDLYTHYLNYSEQSEKRKKIDRFATSPFTEEREGELVTNLVYATAIARLIYYRVKEKLPHADDIDGLARYWKKYYNTKGGAGTIEDFKHHYKEFVLEG